MLIAMASRALETEIDHLYQLPLAEFTPARNALAKQAGADAARVRALTKPPIAAWAVNQLYWQHGDVWNELIAAAENARKAHRAVLAGRSGDVRAAGKVHEEAVEKALKTTMALLDAADHPATDATRHAIATTLRALPGDDAPGRLTKALQPAGFEMLSGFPIAPGPARPSRPAPETAAPKKAGGRAEPKVDAKALTRARHEAASTARALRDAETAARREEFEKVRTEREEKRSAEAVEKAREAVARAKAELEEAEAAAGRATGMRKAAAKRAAEAQTALSEARDRAESAAAALTAMESGRTLR
jgi:hypothetical protein